MGTVIIQLRCGAACYEGLQLRPLLPGEGPPCPKEQRTRKQPVSAHLLPDPLGKGPLLARPTEGRVPEILVRKHPGAVTSYGQRWSWRRGPKALALLAMTFLCLKGPQDGPRRTTPQTLLQPYSVYE